MGERFFVCRPLVLLLTISRKHARVENELVYIVNNLLGGVGRVSVVRVRNCVIYLTLDNIDGVGGGVCLMQELVVCEPVRVGNHGVFLV